MLQKDDILQRRKEESGNKSKKYTASKEQSSNCHKKYDSIVLRLRLVKTEKGSIYIHKILYVVRKCFNFPFTRMSGMRFLMRHGEDHESDKEEGWSLTVLGVEQVRNAAGKILAKILAVKSPMEVTILHTPMKRWEESAYIIKQELSQKLTIKEVKPHSFLKHREDLEILKDVTEKTVRNFFLKNKPWKKEAHILISHADVLRLTAKWRASIKKDSFAKVHKYYEHGDVTNEYGEPLDTNDSNKK